LAQFDLYFSSIIAEPLTIDSTSLTTIGVIIFRSVVNPIECIVPHRIIWSRYTGRWWVDCSVTFGTGEGYWAGPQPAPVYKMQQPTYQRPLLYIGPLLCGFSGP